MLMCWMDDGLRERWMDQCCVVVVVVVVVLIVYRGDLDVQYCSSSLGNRKINI